MRSRLWSTPLAPALHSRLWRPPFAPALQRLRFLAISSRNLDEFFCKRVGALKRQEAAGVENLICAKSRTLLWTPTQSLKIVARYEPSRSGCPHSPFLLWPGQSPLLGNPPQSLKIVAR